MGKVIDDSGDRCAEISVKLQITVVNFRSQPKYLTFHPSFEKAKLNASDAYVTLDEKFFINSCSAKCEWLHDKPLIQVLQEEIDY